MKALCGTKSKLRVPEITTSLAARPLLELELLLEELVELDEELELELLLEELTLRLGELLPLLFALVSASEPPPHAVNITTATNATTIRQILKTELTNIHILLVHHIFAPYKREV